MSIATAYTRELSGPASPLIAFVASERVLLHRAERRQRRKNKHSIRVLSQTEREPLLDHRLTRGLLIRFISLRYSLRGETACFGRLLTI